jgi:hypothetical protein
LSRDALLSRQFAECGYTVAMDGQHTTEEELEEYFFGRLTGAPAQALEQHLLICDECALAAAYAEVLIDRITAVMQQTKALSN